jgi:hypothetical protein
MLRLEHDLMHGYCVLLDGIAVDHRPDGVVVTDDIRDPTFYAAIFENKDSAISDMMADELKQARRYIIHGEGRAPVRGWSGVEPTRCDGSP